MVSPNRGLNEKLTYLEKKLATRGTGAGRHNFRVLFFRSQKLRSLDQFGFLDREFEACAPWHETGGFAVVVGKPKWPSPYRFTVAGILPVPHLFRVLIFK